MGRICENIMNVIKIMIKNNIDILTQSNLKSRIKTGTILNGKNHEIKMQQEYIIKL